VWWARSVGNSNPRQSESTLAEMFQFVSAAV
jgi:hypothetical protein